MRARWALVVLLTLGAVVGVAARRTLGAGGDPYVTLGMASIRAGRFTAGADDLAVYVHAPIEASSPLEPSSLEPFALRPREVSVSAFAIDRTEVTVASYARCVEAGACTEAATSFRCSSSERLASRAALPITCVAFEQAARFCQWAGKRLPTELEWEFAARGVAGRRYPWGDAAVTPELLCSRQSEPCSVASHPSGATPEGVFDLAGNVWEWTQSDHCGREITECHGNYKTVRGGPLQYEYDEDQQARSAFRQAAPVSQRDWDLGFRCVR